MAVAATLFFLTMRMNVLKAAALEQSAQLPGRRPVVHQPAGSHTQGALRNNPRRRVVSSAQDASNVPFGRRRESTSVQPCRQPVPPQRLFLLAASGVGDRGCARRALL